MTSLGKSICRYVSGSVMSVSLSARRVDNGDELITSVSPAICCKMCSGEDCAAAVSFAPETSLISEVTKLQQFPIFVLGANLNLTGGQHPMNLANWH